ncbi:MAG: response regulator [Chloroflexi bacterium]|nr:response regulator [Chloroflexota bacterium]
MVIRVLAAEDDADIRRLVSIILQRKGCTILEAGTGDETVEVARRERPDIIILDMLMPGGTGLEVARTLSQDPATTGIPIILLTALSRPFEDEETPAPNIRRYLAKPFEPAQILESVQGILGINL